MFKNNGEILLRKYHFIVIFPKTREHYLRPRFINNAGLILRPGLKTEF